MPTSTHGQHVPSHRWSVGFCTLCGCQQYQVAQPYWRKGGKKHLTGPPLEGTLVLTDAAKAPCPRAEPTS